MATYSPLATAIISLATASFEREGFGIPAFFTPHRFSKERVTIVTEDSYDLELPIGSPAFEAAKSAFAQQNGLSQLYIGRVEADAEITLPEAPAQNDTFRINIEVNDGDSVEITYTEVGASPTQESVLTAIEAAIAAATDVAAHITTSVTGTGATAKLSISPTLPTDYFLVGGLVKLSDKYITTETADQAFVAIAAENNAFYGVTTSDKTPAWLLDLADIVNSNMKQFWFTVDEIESLEALTDPATDTLGTMAEKNLLRVVGGYHQDANTTYPEVAALAFNLPFPAGSIVWGNDITSGVEASRDEDNRLLSVTHKQNLLNRNAFFWDEQGGLTFLNSDLKSSSGERPENVRGKDNMVVDIEASVGSLLLQQVGKKLPYNNQGITTVVSVIDSVLQTYVQRNFIENEYVITAPDARLIAGGIKASQKLNNLTFKAQLTGAITMVDAIRGTLQLDEVLQ